MPTVNPKITSGADDGGFFTNAGGGSSFTLVSGAAGVEAGHQYGFGLRFQNVLIPQGATISSATLNMVKETTLGSPVAKVYGSNIDNAPAWATTNKMRNITKTSQSASLDVTHTSSVTTITTIVQAIVNRAGWASGNAMALGGFNAHALAGTNVWIGYLYEKGGANIPSMSITYTTGGSTRNSNFFMLF